ncbi:uncharacterized protein LOC134187408 [Corticium candelabrum]|uniref:uncharacterized protein LOC134187408 n=1 Tax=Corticium candelabrum TaxID=121492 RepID=UPI002E25D09D|nr:uncharacterized protein LOC134187408 [Corticium candelabrum]
MASAVRFVSVSILLLELSIHGVGSPLRSSLKPETPTADAMAIPEGCELRKRTFSTKDVNWTRLILDSGDIDSTVSFDEEMASLQDKNSSISLDENFSSIHDISFTISYCSGRCLQHNLKTKGHVIKNDYALQMRNLVKSCEDKGTNCEEMSPCCVPKRIHGEDGKIEFEKGSVKVAYWSKQNVMSTFTFKFLNTTVCHCQ